LVIARDDFLISYGSSIAEERLMQNVKQWIELGMPSAASFELEVYPIDFQLTADENQWIVKDHELNNFPTWDSSVVPLR